jgi:hypothetical protein
MHRLQPKSMSTLHFSLGTAILLSIAAARLEAAAADDKAVSLPSPAAPDASSNLDDYFRPVIDARYDYYFPMDLKSTGGQLGDSEVQADIPLPPLKTDQFVLIPKFYYRFDQADIDTPSYHGVFDLHTLRVPVEAFWLSRDTPWLVFGYLESGISTDFSALNSNSFDLEVCAEIGYRFSPNLTLGLGGFYTNEYGRNTVLPGAGMIWTPAPVWTVALTPVGFNVVYKCSDESHVKLEALPYGGRWTAENDGQEQKIEFHGGKAGLLFEHRLFERCWVGCGGGIDLFNYLRVGSASGLPLVSEDGKPGLYLTGGIRWQF